MSPRSGIERPMVSAGSVVSTREEMPPRRAVCSRADAEFQGCCPIVQRIPAAFATAMISAVAARPPACRGTHSRCSQPVVRREQPGVLEGEETIVGPDRGGCFYRGEEF